MKRQILISSLILLFAVVVTASATPPSPDPSQWAIKPKIIRLQPTPQVRMQAVTATDVNLPVQYYFTCTYIDPPGPPPSSFDSNWITSSTYTITSGLTMDSTYTFTVKARDGLLNETADSNQASVTISGQGVNILTVPAPFPTIQSAIDAASDGDVVEVRPYPLWPYTYRGSGNSNIDFGGRAIVVRSIDPNDPNTVASTVIDCSGSDRAFIFQNGEDYNSVVTGFTITDCCGVSNGGAIACYSSSQPIIKNCIISNCVVRGQSGSSGADGADGSDGSEGNPGGTGGAGTSGLNGGNGGFGGNACGGALYFSGGAPQVIQCQITNCGAIGGTGGSGGNGGNGGNGGRGGDGANGTEMNPNGQNGGAGGAGGPGGFGGHGGYGGNGFGGAIYYAAGCQPIIVGCDITDCYTTNGIGGEGGDGGNGGIGGNGGNGGTGVAPDGEDGFGGNGGTGGAGRSGGNGGYDGFWARAGAIYYGLGCDIYIENTTIRENIPFIYDGGSHSGGNGGAGGAGGTGGTGREPGADGQAGSDGSSGGSVSGNETMLRGGGNYYEEDCIAEIISCTISDNRASGQNINGATGEGGGEYYEPNCMPVFYSCRLEDNTANIAGGGIYFNKVSMPNKPVLNYCDVMGNIASWAGGGICGGDMDSVSLMFAIDVCDSNFSNNYALYGGAMYLEEAILTVIDSNFSDNVAYEGAGMWDYNCVATVKGCTVWNNSAVFGGGFSFIDGLATIDNSYFSGNDASTSELGTGGALFFEEWSDYPHQITNCLIAGNTAYAYGAGISNNRGSWIQITNCTIAENRVVGPGSAGGGVSNAEYLALVDIHNSILWGNEAVAGGSQIAVGNPYGSYPFGDGPYADVGVSYSDVEDGTDGVWLEDETQTYTALWWMDGNIDTDPLFASTGVGGQDYFLSRIAAGQLVDSPCVDVGLGDACDLELIIGMPLTTRTDLETDSGNVDMGYHYRVDVVTKYSLSIEVLYGTGGTLTATAGGDDAFTIIAPSVRLVKAGTVVSLTATLDNPSNVVIWSGTNDDFSDSSNNTVIMNSHKEVTVEFYTPRILYVPGDYPTIQNAIDNSRTRDVIEISSAPQPYYTQAGFEIDGRQLTITSTNPDDPCCVANTIVEMDYGPGGAIVNSIFRFYNVNNNTILNGLTIRGYLAGDVDAQDGTECPGNMAGGNGGWHIGGAIECFFNASPIIKNCVIVDNTMLGDNGGNGFSGCTDNPDGGEGGWPGRAYGAGAAFYYNSNPIFINCTFRNNTAMGGDGGDGGNGNALTVGQPGTWGNGGPGGGWYYGEGHYWYNHDWRNGEYVDAYGRGYFDLYTEYTGRGGAVYVGPGCSPEFIGCTFTGNRSFGGLNGICGQGGAPYTDRYEPNIRYRIDNFGGAVYIAGNSTAQFVRCVFNNNFADTDIQPAASDSIVSYGGAIAFEEGADIYIEDCIFSDNAASIGGGLYWSSSNPLLEGCSFVGNSASHGGGVFFVGGVADIIESTFIENEATATAGQGGGICSLGADVGIIDCNISNNDANGSGGGIYISNKNLDGEDLSGDDVVLVENCLITNNFASRDGGGISANWYTEPNIFNCTIADNIVTGIGFETSYGGGVYCSYNSYADIINSILWGNSAQRGPQLAVGTGFESSPSPSTVSVSYSDLQGGQTYVFVDTNCTLNWGLGNIHLNPLFVVGPLGSYYLSQIAAGQFIDSNCVDTGNDSAENLGYNMYTTRSDEVPDRKTVDMGYHYPFTPDAEPCRYCELFRDGIINFEDFAIFALSWLDEDCNPANEWCDHADITFDTYVNYEDLDFFAECWLIEDIYPPVPNPSEWEVEPYPLSTPQYPNSIGMVAQTADDAWDFWVGNVQYFFDCVSGDCVDSGWQNEPNYIDANLIPGNEYGYRVRARDSSMQIPNDGTGQSGNKTDWSPIRYAVVGAEPPPSEDITPPTPDPMTWALVPEAVNSAVITMTATTATDTESPPVQYYFECTTDGNKTSGWQEDPNYLATGLTPSTLYTFRVQASDSAIPSNVTGWSDPCSATTLAINNPPANPDWAVIPYEYGGTTPNAHMEANIATDPEGTPVEYYFQCLDYPDVFSGNCADPGGFSSGWQTGEVWDVCLDTPGQGYRFRFKVRDTSPELKESGWSSIVYCYPQ